MFITVVSLMQPINNGYLGYLLYTFLNIYILSQYVGSLLVPNVREVCRSLRSPIRAHVR